MMNDEGEEQKNIEQGMMNDERDQTKERRATVKKAPNPDNPLKILSIRG